MERKESMYYWTLLIISFNRENLLSLVVYIDEKNTSNIFNFLDSLKKCSQELFLLIALHIHFSVRLVDRLL